MSEQRTAEKHPKNPLKLVNLIMKIENKNQMIRENSELPHQQNDKTKKKTKNHQSDAIGRNERIYHWYSQRQSLFSFPKDNLFLGKRREKYNHFHHFHSKFNKFH